MYVKEKLDLKRPGIIRKLKTPGSYYENLIIARRQTGRTEFLIDSVPQEEEYIVISTKQQSANDIKKSIIDKRGIEVAERGTFIGASIVDLLDFNVVQLQGNSKPVYIDDAVFDNFYQVVEKLTNPI